MGAAPNAEAHMNVHLSFKAGKSPEIEREFQNHIQKLNRRLRAFKPDLVHLHALVDHAPHQELSISLNLRLPSGQMAATSTSSTAEASLKAAFVDLLSQITRHKDLLRGNFGRKSHGGDRGQRLAKLATMPFEETFASVASVRVAATEHASTQAAAYGEDGIVNLDHLREYVVHELNLRVASGRIRPGQITADEVIDEVMVAALSRENGDAQLLPEENYFHRLALRAIRQLMNDNADIAEVSLDAPAGRLDLTNEEVVVQFHQPDGDLKAEFLLPDPASLTPEEIYSNEEMVAQLDIVLDQVGPQDREAFILFTLEGFTIEEIGRLSDRPPEAVRKSIHHARERVQKNLPVPNEFRRSLLQRSRVA
jgi:RNA polymerase sigma factor (sigma-70 family)